jgi:hypothetical protein
LDEEKLKCADLAQHNFTSAAAGKTSSNDVHLSVILLTVSDWPMEMIDPGGLLLLVPLLFDVQVSLLLVGLQKTYITKLGCVKYCCRVTY